jgi:MYXO-CTERM domain-containing protein
MPETDDGVMGWMPEILLLAAAGLVTFGGILRRRSKIHL